MFFCKSVPFSSFLLFYLIFANRSHFHLFCCFFLFLHISPFSFIFCRLVLESKNSPHATQANSGPGVRFPLVQRHMWQPIKGHHCTSQNQIHSLRAKSQTETKILSPFSWIKFTNPEKVQEHSSPNRFFRIKIQRIQWSLHRFSEILY